MKDQLRLLFEYDFCQRDFPALWKARNSFRSGCALSRGRMSDDAASRFYYAYLHTTHEFIGYKGEGREDIRHGEVPRAFNKAVGDTLLRKLVARLMSRAGCERHRADYTPHSVEQDVLDEIEQDVKSLLENAFAYLSIEKVSS